MSDLLQGVLELIGVMLAFILVIVVIYILPLSLALLIFKWIFGI